MAKRTVGLTDFYVYVLFRENGVPFYIGKGRGNRWNGHEKEAIAGSKNHRHRVIRKMQAIGLEIPKIKIHEGLSEETAHLYEIALIAAIGRYPNGPLVNMTDGGEGISGAQFSDATRHKMSENNRNRSPEHTAKLLEKRQSEEYRARQAAIFKGRKFSQETLAKMSEKARNRSSQCRENMAAAQRGKVMSTATRRKMFATYERRIREKYEEDGQQVFTF